MYFMTMDRKKSVVDRKRYETTKYWFKSNLNVFSKPTSMCSTFLALKKSRIFDTYEDKERNKDT